MVCRLKDIADRLNISVNTVSRALNDKDNISDALKERVRATASEMGYVPNLSASSLRTGQTKTVAIVFDNNFNPYYSIVTGLLQQKLFSEKYNVLMFSDWTHRAMLSAEMVRQMLARGIDGIISYLDPEEEACALIESAGKKLLVIGRECAHSGVECVTTDDFAGGYLAAEYLTNNGHRDILMLSADPSISCARQRREGYRSALEQAGIAYRPEYVLYLNRDAFGARGLIRAAEERGLDYSAVFCFNDMMAYAAMMQFQELGKRVPEDVSVVGYDYVESHFFLPVGLTTVDADKAGLADVTVDKMIAMLEGEEKNSAAEIAPPKLVGGRTVSRLDAVKAKL